MMTIDPVDAIMHVMPQAFDPAFGEAWNRRQVADALLLSNTHCLLVGQTADEEIRDPEDVLGFAMSRQALDEEELLLIAVIPEHRRRGLGKRLLRDLFDTAASRGTRRIFLEMRDGNPAVRLYLEQGFEQIGRRRDYYRSASGGPIDAVTFAKNL